jgi:hypothetical protein
MARSAGKLKAVNVGRPMKPGMHGDGNGLYLQVTGAGGKSWIFRYTLHGKAREMGLGPLSALGLADARMKAAECKRLCLQGIDPIEARKTERDRATLDRAKGITFRKAAETYIEKHRADWRNAKTAKQWASTLKQYADPVMGDVSIQAIDKTLVMKVLEPIWWTKPHTASRVSQRIETILNRKRRSRRCEPCTLAAASATAAAFSVEERSCQTPSGFALR